MNPLLAAMMQTAGAGAQMGEPMPPTIGSDMMPPGPLPPMAGMQPMMAPGTPPVVPQAPIQQPFFQPGTQQFDLAAAIAESQQRKLADEARMEMLKAAAKPKPQPVAESRNF